MKLIYVGKGAWLPGVPARDLNEEEAKFYGTNWLLDSGIYTPAEEPKKSKRLETPTGDGGE